MFLLRSPDIFNIVKTVNSDDLNMDIDFVVDLPQTAVIGKWR